jgi:L-lactate dehydrogenase complex protein LldG
MTQPAQTDPAQPAAIDPARPDVRAAQPGLPSASVAAREKFLARVRAAQPTARPRPEVPDFEPVTHNATDRIAYFTQALDGMGGKCVDLTVPGAPDALELIRSRFGDLPICSATAEVQGDRPLDASMSPASMHDVEVAVVRARFGVAETGSVWFSETEYVVNSIGYLAQHLVILLDPDQIVPGVQDAYRRPDFAQARYAVLVTGPSATADIEGILIRGAQGVRSLTVLFKRA